MCGSTRVVRVKHSRVGLLRKGLPRGTGRIIMDRCFLSACKGGTGVKSAIALSARDFRNSCIIANVVSDMGRGRTGAYTVVLSGTTLAR